MPNYSTYQSPIDRMGAIAQVGGEVQRQKAVRDEMPFKRRMQQLAVTGAEGEQHSEKQRMDMLDTKLKETNLAGDAYELSLMDDNRLMSEIGARMPEFAMAAQQENAPPEEIRKRLTGIYQRGEGMGVFKTPVQQEIKDTRSPQRKLYDETQADPAFAASQEKGPSESLSAKQEEIAAMEALGVSNEVATKGAYNKYTITNHPTTGKISIVDETTGQVRDADSLTLRAIVNAIPQDDSLREGPSLDLYKDIDETVTGFAPQMKQALQSTVGQVFGVEFLPPEVQEKRQLFVMQQKNLVRALMQSPRFLATEREAIEKEIDIAPKAWTDTQTLRSKFRAIDKSLRNRLMNERNKARNPSTSSDDVADAIQKGSIIEDFLRNMAVPQGGEEEQSAEDEALINKYL